MTLMTMSLYVFIYSNDCANRQNEHVIRVYSDYQKALCFMEDFLPAGIEVSDCKVYLEDEVVYYDGNFNHWYRIAKRHLPDPGDVKTTVYVCDVCDSEYIEDEELELFWNEEEALEWLHEQESVYFQCDCDRIKHRYFDSLGSTCNSPDDPCFDDPSLPGYYYDDHGIVYTDISGARHLWYEWAEPIR